MIFANPVFEPYRRKRVGPCPEWAMTKTGICRFRTPIAGDYDGIIYNKKGIYDILFPLYYIYIM